MFGREKLNALLGDSDTTLADIMPTLETQWHNNPRNQTHTPYPPGNSLSPGGYPYLFTAGLAVYYEIHHAAQRCPPPATTAQAKPRLSFRVAFVLEDWASQEMRISVQTR